MASIYNEYYKVQAELELQHGKHSIVLMQVGSFYEAYGVNLPLENPPIKIGYAEEVSEVLGMKVARKGGLGVPHSKKNPMMVGFPDYALGNHLSKLLKAGFTVAIYDQHDSITKKGKKDRNLSTIYSSSTYIDEDICESNALMVVDVNKYKCPISKKLIFYFRCAIFELKTGNITLTEVYNTPEDDNRVDTELYRIIHTFNPSEIVVCCSFENNTRLGFDKRYDTEGRKVSYIPLEKSYSNVAFQEGFLRNIYGKKTTIESIGLIKHTDLIPYLIHGLQYVKSHDELLILQVKYPTILEDHNNLILNNDSIYQLHLVEKNSTSDFGTSKIRSLFGLLNKTRTAMGKRLLRSRLLMPTTDVDELEYRYALIGCLLLNYEDYDIILRDIADIELKYRKMSSKKLHPYELANLNDTFVSIKLLLELAEDTFYIEENVTSLFDMFYEEYINTFNLEILAEYKLNNVKNSYFKESVCPEVDEIQECISENYGLLNEIVEKLSAIIGPIHTKCYEETPKTNNPNLSVTIDSNLNDKFYLKTTNIRFNKVPKTFKCKLSDGSIIKYADFQVTKLKSVTKLSLKYIDDKGKLISDAQRKLIPTINAKYFDTLQKWCVKYSSMFASISQTVALIDFTMSAAKVAVENKYVEPLISKSEHSFFKAKNLRHPIIEKIVTKTPYVNNDFEIGTDHKGSIIYGVNMSGKSSLLRSIGMSVIMAQSGMYVPASSFEFYPFNSIISKITVQDNYFKGQSLFMVELEEINNMLRRGDNHTLVLSDELCSSTETSSAHAIVASTLKTLSFKNVNFIFSTHLHELQHIPEIKNDKNLKILHFGVTVKNNEMIFDRKLQKGGITDTYGLEIAGALGLPKDFIKDAFNIRDTLRGENTESTKESRYSKNVFMKECSLCKSTKSLETHHILFQCTAKNGIIIHDNAPIHVHQDFNLMVVCRECHIRIHKLQEKVEIKPLSIKLSRK
jgi:DNA mismatch repair protein MutS